MKIEEQIGQRLRARRENLGWTLEAVGAALEPFLGRPWTAQAVWQAEQGKRDFRISQIVAFALTLEVSLAYLLLPDAKASVSLSDARELTRAETEILLGPTRDQWDLLGGLLLELDGLDERLTGVWQGAEKARSEAWEVRSALSELMMKYSDKAEDGAS